MKDDNILTHEIMPYKNLPRQIAGEVYQKALSRADLSPEQLDYCVATGFGKKAVSYANAESSEVMCLNRAFRFCAPEVRTIIDAGGQSMRAININQKGKVIDSTVNEKCAAGTGKFIEVMARALELPLEEIGELPFSASDPVSITSQCGVFAESEVITYVNDGRESSDIVAGIARSVANKISSLVRRISMDEKFAMVGGVAKNKGVMELVKEELGIKLVDLDEDPQIYGALGAALVAREKHTSK
jgi:predicted CoA-substrate-specific enzyme activase